MSSPTPPQKSRRRRNRKKKNKKKRDQEKRGQAEEKKQEEKKPESEKDKEPEVEIEYVTEEPEIYDPNFIFFKRIFEAFKVRLVNLSLNTAIEVPRMLAM